MTEIYRVPGSNPVSRLPSEKDPLGKLPSVSGSSGVGASDQVSFSEVSQVLSQISQSPGTSPHRLEEVRQQIVQGRYSSDGKIKQALGNFVAEVFGF